MKKRSIYCFIFLKRICLFLVIFFLFSNGVFSQTTIKGKVTGPDGNGIEGATVNVKGTQTSTVTNTTGDYSIKVPGSNSVLVFSFIGFTTKEEKVGARTTISPNLITSASDLDQVIVIGYGTQKKRDVTGAITSVSAKQIQERQAVTLEDALQGQAAGLFVINNAGEPGATGTIQIRGGSTFSSAGNAPLYVIDGVVGASPDNINPSDIQSIDVLKDAASSAIYGSRAANGVIIITTKRGIEGKPKITANYLHKNSIFFDACAQKKAAAGATFFCCLSDRITRSGKSLCEPWDRLLYSPMPWQTRAC